MPSHRPNATDVEVLHPALLSQVGFTDHAIQRFAQRAGLAVTHRAVIEPIIRDLLAQEGLIAHHPPRWARSQHPADLHLQIGQWMLFICRHNPHHRGRYAAITAVNGPAGNTWTRALQRGYIATPPPIRLAPPPRRQRARWSESIRIGLRQHRHGGSARDGLLAAITVVHRARLATFAVQHASAVSAHRRARDEHQQRRRNAHQQHLSRYGNQPTGP